MAIIGNIPYFQTNPYESRSKWLKTTLVLQDFFKSEMCSKHCKAIGPPQKQSIKLGVNQANTVVHIHRTGKTDEGYSTCGALFPAVTISFGIQLAHSPSFSLSLSLCLWQISFEQCHMLEGLFCYNISDNLAITICCTWPPGQAREPFP